MNIKSFLRFVELPTKVASIIPFLMGTLYALYRFEDFYVLRFGLMFVSLLSFDMATTAINNYYDFKKASKTHGYGYETHNPIVHFKLKSAPSWRRLLFCWRWQQGRDCACHSDGFAGLFAGWTVVLDRYTLFVRADSHLAYAVR